MPRQQRLTAVRQNEAVRLFGTGGDDQDATNDLLLRLTKEQALVGNGSR